MTNSPIPKIRPVTQQTLGLRRGVELLITLHSGESDYQASRKTGVMLPWQVAGSKSNWKALIG